MFLGKRVALPLFFERAVIEISPRRAFLWEDGRTDRAPQVFELAGVGAMKPSRRAARGTRARASSTP